MSRAWMPFYGADFIGNTLHLSRGEIGSYVLLLWHHWEHGSLPANEAELRRIARVEHTHWRHVWAKLGPLFETDVDSPTRIVQRRLRRELSKTDEISSKRKAAAEQMHSKRRASAEQMQSQSQSHTEEAKASSVVPLAAKRGSRLSNDWQPSDADLKFAGDLGLRLYEIDGEIPKFIDHWANKPGKAGIMLDWSRTWRNWCRHAIELKPNSKSNGNGQHRSDVVDAGERLIAAEKARTGDCTGPLLDLTPASSTTSDPAPGPLPKR
jgi:uncharacterized protein YdaU (DUF1376 family)